MHACLCMCVLEHSSRMKSCKNSDCEKTPRKEVKRIVTSVSSNHRNVLGMCFHDPPRCSAQALNLLQLLFMCPYGKTCFRHVCLVLVPKHLLMWLLTLRVWTAWCSESSCLLHEMLASLLGPPLSGSGPWLERWAYVGTQGGQGSSWSLELGYRWLWAYPSVVLGTDLGPPQEQQVFLTAEDFSSPAKLDF